MCLECRQRDWLPLRGLCLAIRALLVVVTAGTQISAPQLSANYLGRLPPFPPLKRQSFTFVILQSTEEFFGRAEKEFPGSFGPMVKEANQKYASDPRPHIQGKTINKNLDKI